MAREVGRRAVAYEVAYDDGSVGIEIEGTVYRGLDAKGLGERVFFGEKRPWRFTIVFDEERARQNGYDVDELYDCVGRYMEPRGNVRTGRGARRQRGG